MFKEMKRKDRELEITEGIEILRSCDYGILSTVSEYGYAYGVPVSYVYMNNAIYFHSSVEGHKLDKKNAEKNIPFSTI